MGVASYPRDSERHVEVLSTLQPEAPGPRAWQRHCVAAHSLLLERGSVVASSGVKRPLERERAQVSEGGGVTR